ncbi:MAG: GNAT family N-acetyltransferase [Clostridia bacterium]|nr:GNAT family N-acetyltransferase [Clostridia bacterium]
MLYYAKKKLNNGEECIFRSPVGIRDASSLLSLSCQLLAETGYLEPMSDPELCSETALLELAAESANLLILVAEKDGSFVGSACLMNAGNEKNAAGEIGIAVKKAEWGNGIGSHFLRILIRKAKAAGYPCLHLTVKQENDRAMQLYLRSGFTVTDVPSSALQPIGMTLNL